MADIPRRTSPEPADVSAWVDGVLVNDDEIGEHDATGAGSAATPDEASRPGSPAPITITRVEPAYVSVVERNFLDVRPPNVLNPINVRPPCPQQVRGTSWKEFFGPGWFEFLEEADAGKKRLTQEKLDRINTPLTEASILTSPTFNDGFLESLEKSIKVHGYLDARGAPEIRADWLSTKNSYYDDPAPRRASSPAATTVASLGKRQHFSIEEDDVLIDGKIRTHSRSGSRNPRAESAAAEPTKKAKSSGVPVPDGRFRAVAPDLSSQELSQSPGWGGRAQSRGSAGASHIRKDKGGSAGDPARGRASSPAATTVASLGKRQHCSIEEDEIDAMVARVDTSAWYLEYGYAHDPASQVPSVTTAPPPLPAVAPATEMELDAPFPAAAVPLVLDSPLLAPATGQAPSPPPPLSGVAPPAEMAPLPPLLLHGPAPWMAPLAVGCVGEIVAIQAAQIQDEDPEAARRGEVRMALHCGFLARTAGYARAVPRPTTVEKLIVAEMTDELLSRIPCLEGKFAGRTPARMVVDRFPLFIPGDTSGVQRYNLKVNDEATRYAVVRTLLEDPRVWSSLYKGEPVTTTRSFEEPLKGIGMGPFVGENAAAASKHNERGPKARDPMTHDFVVRDASGVAVRTFTKLTSSTRTGCYFHELVFDWRNVTKFARKVCANCDPTKDR